jgi:PAB1-binding protein PBP1
VEHLDEQRYKIGQFNQFEENKKKFGYKSTYTDEAYTTKLDHSEFSEHQKRQALSKANEIERQITSDKHMAEERGQKEQDDFDDEEMKYSGVYRNSSKTVTGTTSNFPMDDAIMEMGAIKDLPD